MSVNRVEKYVALALKNYDLIRYEIKLEPENKADGYSGDIIFATVVGSTKEGENKSIHLVLKISKENEELRKQVPMREASLNEIRIYEVVRKAFEKFQKDKGLDYEIRFMPFCYGTMVESDRETLVLDNLKMQGFEMWDKTRPMTIEHLRLVLEAFGQWHALSMALKIQEPQIFEKLVENNVNMFSRVVEAIKVNHLCVEEFLNARDKLNAREASLQFSEDEILYAFKEMYFEEPEYHVILHGDCWNNNFLFKTPSDPTDVRILDWQASGLASPAFDLSHFIFCCADTEQHQDVTELLRIYYGSLSKHLTSYGCDPEAIYPFHKLVEHWKRFSRFGFFLSLLVIKVCVNSEMVSQMTDTLDQGEDISETFKITVDDGNEYYKRARSHFRFYCKNVENSLI